MSSYSSRRRFLKLVAVVLGAIVISMLLQGRANAAPTPGCPAGGTYEFGQIQAEDGSWIPVGSQYGYVEVTKSRKTETVRFFPADGYVLKNGLIEASSNNGRKFFAYSVREGQKRYVHNIRRSGGTRIVNISLCASLAG